MTPDSTSTDSSQTARLRNLGDDEMMRNSGSKTSELNDSYISVPNARIERFSYFIITVLGFSIWFFMAVPFASHRESYEWLAMVQNQDFSHAFYFISKTYRPLAQGASWLGFLILDPSVFPTSVLRQALLQGFIYGLFVIGWWIIYAAVAQRRLFAAVAFIAGGVFFSGYVQLFHIYGLFYVPVMLILGALLRCHASGTFAKREVWFAVVATLLAFWHPFATALFVGFYFGFYLDTFGQRGRAQHFQAAAIFLVSMMAIVTLVVAVPTRNEPMSLDARLFGFLVSYQTNEVNLLASLVSFLLTLMVVFSTGLSPRLKLAACLCVSGFSVLFLLNSLPLLLLWLCAVSVKLICLRRWSLLFLTLTAGMLPFGGGIGTPIYALFAIVVAIYVTPLGWSRAEEALSCFRTRYAIGTIVAATIVVLMVRSGINVPIVTRVARPLLTERERTYQLENILAWLHNSSYCGYEVAFVENAGNPIDSVEGAITRRNRPPAGLKEVQIFWDTVLQCHTGERSAKKTGTSILTFGGPALANLSHVYEVSGRYAGTATVWIRNPEK